MPGRNNLDDPGEFIQAPAQGGEAGGSKLLPVAKNGDTQESFSRVVQKSVKSEFSL